MAYLGFWEIDDYLTFYCNTHGTDGIAVDADAVPPYRIYEDETGAAIANATMALLDAANTVGFYSERIQLTAVIGYEVGKQYVIYIAATVGGDVGTISHTFTIPDLADTAEISDGVWDEAAAGHTDAGKAGEQLWTDVDAILQDTGTDGVPVTSAAVTDIRSVVDGTADSGNTVTMVDAARAEADDDYWNGDWILFTSGTIAGQARLITDFDQASDTITFTPALTQVVATQTYEILPAAAITSIFGVVGSVAGAVGSVAGNVDGNVTGNVTGTVASVNGNVDGNVTGNVTGNVDGSTASVTAGVTLEIDAIKAVSYDETTAWPVTASDAGATQIARVGADGDTLETISDQIDGTAVPGSAMTLAADAIKAVSFDEATAWPVVAADAGATQIARVGADGDTLETLSDQIDLQATAVALATADANIDAILLDTGTTGVVSVVGDVGGNVVGDVQGNVDGSVASVTALSAAAVDSILDEVVEGTTTFREMLRAFMAALANEATGGGTLAHAFRDIADTKDRIATTVDVNGNRLAVTLDLT